MSIQRLRKHLHIYDQRRRSFLSRISELPPGLLSIKPGPTRWSLIQVLEHLGTHLRQVERIKKDIKDALPEAGRTPQHP